MPIIHFMGYVEPRETYVNAENLTMLTELDIDTGRVVKYTLAILDSVVSVECDVDIFNIEDISRYYTRAVELSKTFVCLISFKMGWGLFVHLDTFIHPDGTEEKMFNQANFLTGIADSYDINDFDNMYERIGCDIDLSAALGDLNDSLARPRVAPVNCSRVLDTVRNQMAPGLKDKAAWLLVQESLNTDEAYLQYISNMSKSPRHGKHSYPTRKETEELLRRTWIIFNRFLHYRIQSLTKLPSDRFPQLTNPPIGEL
jgi:hypothetical protein